MTLTCAHSLAFNLLAIDIIYGARERRSVDHPMPIERSFLNPQQRTHIIHFRIFLSTLAILHMIYQVLILIYLNFFWKTLIH